MECNLEVIRSQTNGSERLTNGSERHSKVSVRHSEVFVRHYMYSNLYFSGSRPKNFWDVSLYGDAIHALAGGDQAGAVHRVHGPHLANIQGQNCDNTDALDNHL